MALIRMQCGADGTAAPAGRPTLTTPRQRAVSGVVRMRNERMQGNANQMKTVSFHRFLLALAAAGALLTAPAAYADGWRGEGWGGHGWQHGWGEHGPGPYRWGGRPWGFYAPPVVVVAPPPVVVAAPPPVMMAPPPMMMAPPVVMAPPMPAGASINVFLPFHLW